MDPSIAPITQIFGVSTALYDRALAGLDRKTLPSSCKNDHACVPKRHFGVQAWVNRSSRLRTAMELTL